MSLRKRHPCDAAARSANSRGPGTTAGICRGSIAEHAPLRVLIEGADTGKNCQSYQRRVEVDVSKDDYVPPTLLRAFVF